MPPPAETAVKPMSGTAASWKDDPPEGAQWHSGEPEYGERPAPLYQAAGDCDGHAAAGDDDAEDDREVGEVLELSDVTKIGCRKLADGPRLGHPAGQLLLDCRAYRLQSHRSAVGCDDQRGGAQRC